MAAQWRADLISLVAAALHCALSGSGCGGRDLAQCWRSAGVLTLRGAAIVCRWVSNSICNFPRTCRRAFYDLAAQLTLTATTLYDKAAILESYLRQFPYDLSVPEPPITIDDVADYFLFDLQRGLL